MAMSAKRRLFIIGLAGFLPPLGTLSPVEATPSGFSHTLYDTMLKGYLTDGRVDYARLKQNRGDLDRYVSSLAEADSKAYETWNEPTKIAFLINAYNAITLKVILDHHPIQRSLSPATLVFPANSIRQIPGAWDRITHPVMGRPMTLDEIERRILRKEFREPRIHMALVCAAKGCPPLRSEAYEGERLEGQLEDQARRFLSDPAKFRVDRRKGVVWLSPIFQWFGQDFLKVHGVPEGFTGHAGAERAVLAFVRRYVKSEDQAFLKAGNYRTAYLGYDWSLNE